MIFKQQTDDFPEELIVVDYTAKINPTITPKMRQNIKTTIENALEAEGITRFKITVRGE